MLPTVWDSLVKAIKKEAGILSAGEDLSELITRLKEERDEKGAVFDMTANEEDVVQTIFFMHRTMIESFRRCGQFLVMDSTCKTNRFGMSLFLICGFDEHLRCALYGCALMSDETQPSFEYVLKKVRAAVGEEAWLRAVCVATDGCTAMTNAVRRVAPHASQQRCVWHLQQNIISRAGGAHQAVIHQWYQCVLRNKFFLFKRSGLRTRRISTRTSAAIRLSWWSH